MPRPLKLKPYKDPQTGKWRVNVISALSPSGQRERRFFDTQAEAVEFVEELKARRDNLAAVPTLSPFSLLDAATALELLEREHPQTTLVEAVKTFIRNHKARERSVTVDELFRQAREAKQSRSASYKRDLRWAYDRMRPFMTLQACDVTRTHINQAVAGMPDSSRNTVLRALRMVFRYGHDLGYLQELPVRKSEFVEIKRQEPEILPPTKIRRLLEASLEHDPEHLPLLLAETFCGVRPEEAKRLLWSDLDFPRRRLTIRAAISKTGTARPIILAPCTLAWFDEYFDLGLPRIGALVRLSESALRSRLRKIRYHAGFRGAGAHWTPGSLRDAFCSYHLAHFGSIDRMITEAGHTDLRTTKDHYLGLVTAEAAAEFWNLFPPGMEERRIVAFSATA